MISNKNCENIFKLVEDMLLNLFSGCPLILTTLDSIIFIHNQWSKTTNW